MEPAVVIRVFGIRHHGPGSARAMMDALGQWQPDCLLVEAPQEAEGLFTYVTHPKMLPPVAILFYNPQDFNQASYWPMALFSPEYQAIRYGLQQGIPVRAMDLPMALQFGRNLDTQVQITLDLEMPDDEENRRIRHDPLHFLAGLAGYADSERWWEATFEQQEHGQQVFDVILEMMTALREELPRAESPETLLREAWMRNAIRQAIREGFRRIAVVCGAWHTPVLARLDQFSAKQDNSLVKGMKKQRVKTTWIPWSYDRLALQSGYGAGVVSPAWFELIFAHRRELGERWMVRAARLFRQERLDASVAHVQEAVRLAEALAALRQRQIPGIGELEEATLSVFCHGDEAPLDLIREKLVIGDTIGQIPAGLHETPLQEDLERGLKTARLVREFRTTEKLTKELDLRVPANLAASHLLHRLHILDIPWGVLGKSRQENLGAFREVWKLHWKPDYLIRVIQAGMWGNTIREAATGYLLIQVGESSQMTVLLQLLEHALKAELPETTGPLIGRLQSIAATDTDVWRLMQSLPLLVQISRYGNTRKTDTVAVNRLIDEIAPRVCIGLAGACIQLEEELAHDVFQDLVNANHAFAVLRQEEHDRAWNYALVQIATLVGIHPLLAGIGARLLFDRSVWSAEAAADCLAAALSNARETIPGAQWLEGFLYGSASLLIRTPRLWESLDDWVSTLPDQRFQEVLPVLRRTFSKFSKAEREKVLRQAMFPESLLDSRESTFDQSTQGAKAISATVSMLLGLG